MPALLIAIGAAAVLRQREQKQRIALLGHHLGPYRIEQLMENLTQGYLRALGEDDPQRQASIWSLLAAGEQEIASQFQRFAQGFGRLDEVRTRVSRPPLALLPWASRLFPGASFDARAAFAAHAQGIAAVAANAAQRSPRDKAFTMTAELLLMQHTCHWYCRSHRIASARLLLRHQTAYAQVLAAVSPETRAAYEAIVRVRARRGGGRVR